MEYMGKVGLLDPQGVCGGKNSLIKKSHGLVREGKVGFHFCAFSKEKIINIPIIRIPVMATWDDHDSSVNDGG